MPPFEPAHARRLTGPVAPMETLDGGLESDSALPCATTEPVRATLFVRLTSRATGMRWLGRLMDDPAAGAVPRATVRRALRGDEAQAKEPSEHDEVHVQVALSTEVACAFGIANTPDLPFTVRGANAAVVLTAEDGGALKSLVVRQILFAATHGAAVTEVHSTEDSVLGAPSAGDVSASGRRSREGISRSDNPAASGVRAALLLSAAQAASPPSTTRVMDPLPWIIAHDAWMAPQAGRWVKRARGA